MPLIAIYAEETKQQARAQVLAETLQLPLVNDRSTNSVFQYLLVVTADYIGLHNTSDKKFAPFYINFLSDTLVYRRNQASLRKELLARAIGRKPAEQPAILDATAGLGRDSFLLASLGFKITLIERSPIIHALLKDALDRAAANQTSAAIVQNMQLIYADAKDWLEQTTEHPQIIYLDPMFPERKKTASAKKEMVILQNMLGKDDNAQALLNVALTCATERVVVKRPRLAPNISETCPHFSLTGKSSRFDVYLRQK